MKKKEKYIVYIHREYIEQVALAYSLDTLEGIEEIRERTLDMLHRFIYGNASKQVLMIDMFTNSKGEKTKAIEIYRLSNGAKIKELKELQRLRNKQKNRGFVELKK